MVCSLKFGIAVLLFQQALAREKDPLANLSSEARTLLAILVVLTITLIVTNICHKAHFPVPEAIIIVVIGGVAGAIAYFSGRIESDFFLKFEDAMALDFMLILIAPIIFAEGYGMKSRKFFENITRVLMHAFAGTAISAIVVAVFVRYLAPLTGFQALKITECLCFGALISATDPVTTLAIFKEMGMVEKGLGHLYYSVLGESILNDAVGIVLFDGFADFVKEDRELDLAGVGELFLMFCITFFGSMFLGIAFGMITAVVLKVGRLGESSETDHFHFNIPEIATMLAMCYMPFLVATALPPLSGIVAVLFAGVSGRHYAHYNLTFVTRDAFIPFVELLATLSEIYVFILLGMGAFVLQTAWYNTSLLLWTILACLIGRAAQVYPLGCLANCLSRSTKFTVKEMHVQWCAGLRGAVAFMCALAFPGENRGFVIATTIIIAFLSMVLMGWPTPCILRFLKIQGRQQPKDPSMELAEPIHLVSETRAGPERWASRAVGRHRVQGINDRLKRWVMTKDAYAEREAYVAEVTQRAASGNLVAAASDGVIRGVSGALLQTQSAQRSQLGQSQQSDAADTFERASFDQPIGPLPSTRTVGGPLTSDRTVGGVRRQRSGIANM